MSADHEAYIREHIAKQLRQLMRVAEDNGILLTDTMPPTSLAVVLDNLAADLEQQNTEAEQGHCCFPEFWRKPEET